MAQTWVHGLSLKHSQRIISSDTIKTTSINNFCLSRFHKFDWIFLVWNYRITFWIIDLSHSILHLIQWSVWLMIPYFHTIIFKTISVYPFMQRAHSKSVLSYLVNLNRIFLHATFTHLCLNIAKIFLITRTHTRLQLLSLR